jgi:hypothetical protein
MTKQQQEQEQEEAMLVLQEILLPNINSHCQSIMRDLGILLLLLFLFFT